MSHNKKTQLFLGTKIILLLLITILITNISYATDAESPSEDSGPSTIQESAGRSWIFAEEAGLMPSGNVSKPTEIIQFILNIALYFLGTIFLVLIIYSGFMWMTSAGNEEKVKKAKSILKNATMGVILILFSYIITRFIFSAINFTSTSHETGGSVGDIIDNF